MSISAFLQAGLANLIFNGATIANIAINNTTAPLTSFFLSLHSADPGVSGTQLTSEIVYTGYARVAVARTVPGWTITGGSPVYIRPAANIDWPACTALTATATHFSIGSLLTGAGVIYYSGPIQPGIAISTGIVPRLTPQTTITEE